MIAGDVSRFAALEEIRVLKSRYCRAIDTKQWDLLRSLFTHDARFEGFGSAPDGADPDTFVKGVAARLRDAVSVHHCHTPEIVFFDADLARGIWAMQDVLEWPEAMQLKEMPNARGFVGFGYYEEEYRCVDGRWKMHFLRLTRLRVDALPIGEKRAGAALRKVSTDWLARK